MSGFVTRLVVLFAVLNVVTGVFIADFLSLFGVQVTNVLELQWSLILGMPVLLFVSFHWISLHPAENKADFALQAIGFLVLFLAPYGWILRHAKPL